jgi:hypothetical protein
MTQQELSRPVPGLIQDEGVTQPATCFDPYSLDANSETFDVWGWLAGFDPLLMRSIEGRKVLTRYDPLLFALVYLRHHLMTDGEISFGDPHFEWVRVARRWAVPSQQLRGDRHVFVAPRDCGKSTFWFLILPMWAAAHNHKRFAVAFAHSGTQAEAHLHAFRSELSDNALLQEDYPNLCRPQRKPNGKTTADNIQMLRASNGFAFAARGIDAANLGIKERDRRPDLMICDDIEPDEATYSIYQMGKRRGTLLEAILPMNLRATVVLVGTVTMPGSIIHQAVEVAQGTDDPEDWIDEERFKVHYHSPIPLRADGTERSIWPVKWPLEFIQKIRHTRTALKNFWNSPMGVDGGYWSVEDFTYGELPNVTLQVLSLDPTITTTTKSDPAGVAVLSYAPAYTIPADRENGRLRATTIPSRCSVDFCREVRLVGEAIRTYILRVLTAHPRVRLIVVEGNQGGENWRAILHDMPVKVKIVWSTIKKEVRAANLLELYQHNPPRVIHNGRFPALEQQMAAFPKSHDDMIDSVGAVALRLLGPRLPASGTEFPK